MIKDILHDVSHTTMENKLYLFDTLKEIVDMITTEPIVLNNSTPQMRDFILQLLTVEASKRLGGVNTNQLKEHELFKEMDFQLLDAKQITPVYFPTARPPKKPCNGKYKLDEMLERENKLKWIQFQPYVTYFQKYFDNWNYCSLDIILSEQDSKIPIKPFDQSTIVYP